MNLKFFCPTNFEIPKEFRKKTEVFGMGERRAAELAEQLNRSHAAADGIVVYGCAGALRDALSPGQTFIISKINEILTTIPEQLSSLAQASLFTSKVLVPKAELKRELFRQTQADLVDMEMSVIWTQASAAIRPRLIFVRGVIDRLEDELDFIDHDGENARFKFASLISPKKLKQIGNFISGSSKYRRGMNTMLEQITYFFDNGRPLHKEHG